MKKILLTTLNSKYVHMNLAIRYLYEAAAEFRDSLELREFTINNEEDYVFTELVGGGYDLICFSCYIWNIRPILTLAENLKKALPDLKIVLGGPEVSYDRDALLKEQPWVDGILVGEGEKTFPILCREFLEKGLVATNQGMDILEPEAIPFPYQTLAPEPDKTVYYESSRGCPFRCSYCLSSEAQPMRAWPLTRVFRELDYFLEQGVRQVKFIDRTFNWKEDRCRTLLQYLLERDNGITNFHFEMCAELLTDGILEDLSRARPGQFQLEIGIQSTNRPTLEAVNRRGDIRLAGDRIRRALAPGNVHIHLDLIAGLPYESYANFANSFRETYALCPDALQLGFLKVLKGTSIRGGSGAYGYTFRSQPPYEVISSNWLSSGELVRLKQVERVLDLYYNKGGFRQTLDRLIAKEGDSFRFYEELANYYHRKGHQHRSHKKEDLYRILLGFGLEKGLEDEAARAGAAMEAEESLKNLLRLDMQNTLNPEAIKNFERKGFTPL